MAITTRIELQQAVQNYTHRGDLVTQIPGFIDLATKRLGRDLRSAANEKVIDFAVVSNPQQLPIDYAQIRSLVYPGANGNVWISATPMKMAANAQQLPQSGQPMYYSIASKQITITPSALGAYKLDYWCEPAALAIDSDTNQVLIDYPDLYLYATLAEAFFYIQDGDLHKASKDQYREELRMINIQTEQSNAGSAPAMRA
jgi:hypothetical protein